MFSYFNFLSSLFVRGLSVFLEIDLLDFRDFLDLWDFFERLPIDLLSIESLKMSEF